MHIGRCSHGLGPAFVRRTSTSMKTVFRACTEMLSHAGAARERSAPRRGTRDDAHLSTASRACSSPRAAPRTRRSPRALRVGRRSQRAVEKRRRGGALTEGRDRGVEQAVEELQGARPGLQRVALCAIEYVAERLHAGRELVRDDADVRQVREERKVPACAERGKYRNERG